MRHVHKKGLQLTPSNVVSPAHQLGETLVRSDDSRIAEDRSAAIESDQRAFMVPEYVHNRRRQLAVSLACSNMAHDLIAYLEDLRDRHNDLGREALTYRRLVSEVSLLIRHICDQYTGITYVPPDSPLGTQIFGPWRP